MSARPLTLALALAASGLLVACGGSDSGSTASAPAPAAAPAPPPAAPNLAPPPGAAGPGYEVVEVADGGTISGTITYTGDQADRVLTIDKDASVCDHAGHGTKPAGAIAVGGSGGLTNAVVRITDIEKGAAFDPPAPQIDNKDCAFHPLVQVAKSGQQVTALNSDPILHNTHLFLHQGSKNLGNIALPNVGQTAKKPLRKPGLVDVKCDAHKWMRAFIWVSDHPYVAVTGADGAFSFSDVPAGSYTVAVWHEELGEREGSVEVTANGTATFDLAYD